MIHIAHLLSIASFLALGVQHTSNSSCVGNEYEKSGEVTLFDTLSYTFLVDERQVNEWLVNSNVIDDLVIQKQMSEILRVSSPYENVNYHVLSLMILPHIRGEFVISEVLNGDEKSVKGWLILIEEERVLTYMKIYETVPSPNSSVVCSIITNTGILIRSEYLANSKQLDSVLATEYFNLKVIDNLGDPINIDKREFEHFFLDGIEWQHILRPLRFELTDFFKYKSLCKHNLLFNTISKCHQVGQNDSLCPYDSYIIYGFRGANSQNILIYLNKYKSPTSDSFEISAESWSIENRKKRWLILTSGSDMQSSDCQYFEIKPNGSKVIIRAYDRNKSVIHKIII